MLTLGNQLFLNRGKLFVTNLCTRLYFCLQKLCLVEVVPVVTVVKKSRRPLNI